MRVIIDANILVSAVLFKGGTITKFLNTIFENHTLVLTDTIINEARNVVGRKMPNLISDFDEFIDNMPYEFHHNDCGNFENIKLRDEKDKHVITSAYIASAEILVTGDKDFFEYSYEIEVSTPSNFLAKYAAI